eukprot:CAMPEP_0119301710 /NCGR_PEP_ID=MMETSP1333-20130426/3443_1 /TAXON_ID=418940 /ORGANISM="Scyphosphaera apsteinii, Strain RCC1455" /LENGTH=508 /DNA_ID=CAMNT_0007303859 /DNA_START=99 /DNA_END=1625 /DNA_ORIENTATION=+
MPALNAKTIVRSLSFNRKTRKSACDGANKENRAITSEEESSPSRASTPVDVADMPMSRELSGWLRKKHHKSRDQWGMRFFNVDDERGTLSMCKSQRTTKRHKPTVILPLADIKAVHPTDIAKHTFVISCPPIHMTVSADDHEEMELWIVQLTLRSRLWHERLNARNPVAVVADGSRTNGYGFPSNASAEPISASWSVPVSAPLVSDSSAAAPLSNAHAREVAVQPALVPPPAPANDADSELPSSVIERRRTSVELSPSDDRAAALLPPPTRGSEQLPIQTTLSIDSDTFHARLGQAHGLNHGSEANDTQFERCAMPLQQHTSNSSIICETQEFIEEDDDDDDDDDAALLPQPPKSSVDVPPPMKDLAAMLSSDEDDGEDDTLKHSKSPPRSATRCLPPTRTPPSVVDPPAGSALCCSAPAMSGPLSAEPVWYQAGTTTAKLAVMEQQQPQHQQPQHQQPQHRQLQHQQPPDGYSSWDDQPQSEQAPPRAIGDGIAVDNNFADENWDSD